MRASEESRPPTLRALGGPPEETGGDVIESLRVLRLADPGFDTTCRLTFDAGDGREAAAAWLRWSVDVFAGGLLPLLARTVADGAREHAHDILARDREMDAAMDEAAAARSRILGWRLLVDYKPPVGARALGKLRMWALADGRALHFATVFGVRCGVFNIPVPQAAASYLFKEWHCGHVGRLPLGRRPPSTSLDLGETRGAARFSAC